MSRGYSVRRPGRFLTYRRYFVENVTWKNFIYGTAIITATILIGFEMSHLTKVPRQVKLHESSKKSLSAAYISQKPPNRSTATSPTPQLTIPKLKDSIPVASVGLTRDGVMAVPQDTRYAGLYKFGPQPGQIGNAVIDGHNKIRANGNGVFWNLYKLSVGDDIYIQNGPKINEHFVVRSTEKYPATSAPIIRIFGSADKPHLNLITCYGRWSNSLQAYNERLVVYADLVN